MILFLKKHKKLLAALVLVIVAAVISFLPVDTWQGVYEAAGLTDISQTKGDLTVHFIDVGTGDCALISAGGYNILIDSGNSSLEETARYYLKKRGVKRLDILIASHHDKDHVGDMESIVNSLEIGEFWIPAVPEELLEEKDVIFDVLTQLKDKNTVIKNPVCGYSRRLGGLELLVLSPDGVFSEINDYSLVVKLKYKDVSFLFTGDAGEKAEDFMLAGGFARAELSSDVLKVGHHGSASSTSSEFLSAVNPLAAVISVGSNNYNLPSPATISRLESGGIKTFVTKRAGSVVAVSDGKNIEIITEN